MISICRLILNVVMGCMWSCFQFISEIWSVGNLTWKKRSYRRTTTIVPILQQAPTRMLVVDMCALYFGECENLFKCYTDFIYLNPKPLFWTPIGNFLGQFMDVLILFRVLGLQTKGTIWSVLSLFPSILAVTWMFYPADVFLTYSKSIKVEPGLSSTKGSIIQMLLL